MRRQAELGEESIKNTCVCVCVCVCVCGVRVRYVCGMCTVGCGYCVCCMCMLSVYATWRGACMWFVLRVGDVEGRCGMLCVVCVVCGAGRRADR